MCHTSPLGERVQQSSAKWTEQIKLDCLAVIRARCGQALTMVVRPHLLRQGEKGSREGPQLDDLWPREGNHEPRLTAAMDEAGDLLSSPFLSWFTALLRRFRRILFYPATFKHLQYFQCYHIFIHVYCFIYFLRYPKVCHDMFWEYVYFQKQEELNCQLIMIISVHQLSLTEMTCLANTAAPKWRLHPQTSCWLNMF